MDFYCRSNTHDPDQNGFEDLYRRDFIHAISHVARRKLTHHHLDLYQHAAFRRGIVRHNTGEEEANPMLCQDMIFLNLFYFDQFDTPSLNTSPFTSPMFPL